jgi:hypothetical protein
MDVQDGDAHAGIARGMVLDRQYSIPAQALIRAWSRPDAPMPHRPRLSVKSSRHQSGDQAQADSQYRQDGCPDDSKRFHSDFPLQALFNPS